MSNFPKYIQWSQPDKVNEKRMLCAKPVSCIVNQFITSGNRRAKTIFKRGICHRYISCFYFSI